jgi:hypothetical protein
VHFDNNMATNENPTIPKQHKAAVYDKPGSISIKVVDVDTPEPGPGEVLINLQVPSPTTPVT